MTVQVAINKNKDLGVMPHRGMTSLASVGLAHDTLALGLLSVSHHTSRLRAREGEGLSRGTLVPIPINFSEDEIGAILVTLNEKNERQG